MKLFWKISNFLEARYKSITGGTGLLRHKKDERDRREEFGGVFAYKVKNEVYSLFNQELWQKWAFSQNPFNICVFASRVLGCSLQNKIRFSVQWDVKLARKLGMISGDGWSYLRAENDIGIKYGRLPYEYMPDETGGLSWNEYSKWTVEDDTLLEIAAKFKVPEYKSVNSKSTALEALDRGYPLFTGIDWHYAMNRPAPPLFMLLPTGGKVGGHAINLAGYRGWGNDFENPETFGLDYGNNGIAWLDEIFGSYIYSVYIEEPMPIEVRLEHFLKFSNNKIYRCVESPACYLIENGVKSHIETSETFNKLVEKHGQLEYTSQDVLNRLPDGLTIK